MAKGYPTRSEAEGAYPVLDDVIAEGTCIICKKRPAETERGECGVCYAALHQAPT